MAIQRLTVAYRSRSRPSSTLGAKASTMCPYYLDGDQARHYTARAGGFMRAGDTRFSRRLSWRLMWLLCSFQGPRGGNPPAGVALLRSHALAGGGLSKLNSMLRL